MRTLFYLLTGAVSVALAWCSKPHIFADDAAISFRYAKRLAHGLGLSYNDHERVMGFSNPLYTLLLGGFNAVHLDLETATDVLTLGLYVSTVLLSLSLAWAFSNVWGALVTAVLLTSTRFFVYQALSGMESGLAAVLGLLFVVMLLRERDVLAGVLLGLAVTNKLDAGLLALAFFVSRLILYKRIPFVVTVASVATFLPWAVFAIFYYGSIFPNSLRTKVVVHSRQLVFNHWWVIDAFRQDPVHLSLALGVLLFPFFLRRDGGRHRLAAVVLLTWFIAHAAAYSLLNLGDYYPWYLAVLFPSGAILGGAFVARALASVNVVALRRSLAVIVIAVLGPLTLDTVTSARSNPIKRWEAFDNDRRLAGVFIDQYASKDEIVLSGFGWVAFEIDNPFNDGSGLNSHVMRIPVDYVVLHGGQPYDTGSSVPSVPDPGFVPLATFNLANDLFPGHTWFAVFGRTDSKIARSGQRFLQYRLFQLQADGARGPDQGTIRLHGNDLTATIGSETRYTVVNQSQPVRLVYTPVVEGPVGSSPPAVVTFTIGVNGAIVHRQDAGTRPSRPTSVVLPGTEGIERFVLSLMARDGSGNVGQGGSVRWRNVKVIVGRADVDSTRIYDRPLRRAWQRHNPAIPPAVATRVAGGRTLSREGRR